MDELNQTLSTFFLVFSQEELNSMFLTIYILLPCEAERTVACHPQISFVKKRLSKDQNGPFDRRLIQCPISAFVRLHLNKKNFWIWILDFAKQKVWGCFMKR